MFLVEFTFYGWLSDHVSKGLFSFSEGEKMSFYHWPQREARKCHIDQSISNMKTL